MDIKNLNHLGIIAGIIDELGIVEKINQVLGVDKRENITAGQIVKAMILNGLGMVSQPLYLFPNFFKDKPLEHLLGEGITKEDLNDDKIGRVMDKMYEYGLTNLFLFITLEIVKKYQINTEDSHLDSTSINLDGKYEQPGENIIRITRGYSRDHRPDLKQFITNLICSNDGDIPLYLKTSSGNDKDSKMFGKIASEYKKQINFETRIVGDSALYTAENLSKMKGIEWITRVPFTVKLAKELARENLINKLKKSERKGYYFWEKEREHNGIKQRWLVIESQERKKSDLKKLAKKIEEEKIKINKEIGKWNRKNREDLSEFKIIVSQFISKIKYHKITEITYREEEKKIKKNGEKKLANVYKVSGKVEPELRTIESEKNQAGRFVLATNVLDKKELTSEEILTKYKEQQCSERGFRFLKDPLFFADSIFVKNVQRVETMAMIMGLCLLVYSIGQRQLRQNLVSEKGQVKNQVGKLINKPTLRWIFQIFQGIHYVIKTLKKEIFNLTEEQRHILSYFSPFCQKYYLLS